MLEMASFFRQPKGQWRQLAARSQSRDGIKKQTRRRAPSKSQKTRRREVEEGEWPEGGNIFLDFGGSSSEDFPVFLPSRSVARSQKPSESRLASDDKWSQQANAYDRKSEVLMSQTKRKKFDSPVEVREFPFTSVFGENLPSWTLWCCP